jgi:hypothetical protein
VLPWGGDFAGGVAPPPRRLLSQSTLRFRGASSEVEVDQRLWFVITVADGKIVRTEAFTDPEKAMRSIGRSE